MVDGVALIKVDGKIVKPVTVLITKISDAIGGLYKPYQIRRVSKAEADAALIKEQAHIEINDLQRRAFNRLVSEEAKRQDNIETITAKAIPQLTSSSTPQDMDNDWIMNFFDKCRIISDEDMQSLWAKILAGEANSPGAYSKRTINSLASLDKADAQLFNALCGFTCSIGDDLIPFIFHTPGPVPIDLSIYNNNKINFIALAHLSSIGLITFEAVGYYQDELKQQVDISYFDTTVRVEFKNPADNKLDNGNVLLTNVGKELAKVCNSKPIDGFVDLLIDLFSKMGFVVSSLYPRQNM